MSRRPIVAGFATIVGFGLASAFAAWFLTREPRIAEGPAMPPEPPVGSPPPPAPAAGPPHPGPAAASRAARPILKPVESSAPQVHVTPLFAANTRLELGKTAALDFRARQEDSAEPAMGEEISVSVLKMGERAEERLPVREVARGVYRAEFTPRDSGRFMVAVASRGLPATTVPVVVPDGSEASEASDPNEALRDRARGMGGRRRR
jgi:hypothetical protein